MECYFQPSNATSLKIGVHFRCFLVSVKKFLERLFHRITVDSCFQETCKIISKAYLEPSLTYMMEHFYKKSQQLLAVNYFCKKTSSYMFDWVLNVPLYTTAKSLRSFSEAIVTNRNIFSNCCCWKSSSINLKQKTMVLLNCFFNFSHYLFH